MKQSVISGLIFCIVPTLGLAESELTIVDQPDTFETSVFARVGSDSVSQGVELLGPAFEGMRYFLNRGWTLRPYLSASIARYHLDGPPAARIEEGLSYQKNLYGPYVKLDIRLGIVEEFKRMEPAAFLPTARVRLSARPSADSGLASVFVETSYQARIN